jgi:predicted  nucleic acid-binding Zn-ribbon protein
LPDASKYDLFIDELNALEKQVYYFIQSSSELEEANNALKEKYNKIKSENLILTEKINELEKKLSDPLVKGVRELKDSVKAEGKEDLKNKIDELIEIIDYHLRS